MADRLRFTASKLGPGQRAGWVVAKAPIARLKLGSRAADALERLSKELGGAAKLMAKGLDLRARLATEKNAAAKIAG